jgi:hypothetical protein
MSGATAPEAETIIRQTETINRLMGNSATQIERVQRQLDSTYAAQQRYEQAQNAINSAVERGRISQERANQLLQLAQQRYQQTGQAAQQFAVANDNATRSMGRSGQIIGQAGFQIQDFASQIAGGTSALTAFAQQAPQFLGVFGAGGAIAGAAVAIGAVAASLLLAGDNGAAAAQRIEEGFRATQRAGEDLTRVVSALSGELLTASERAANLANNQRAVLVAEGRSQMMRLENERTAAGDQQMQAQRDLAAADRDEARFRRMGPGFDSELRDVQGRRFSAQSALDRARSTQDQVTQQINELRRLTDRAEMIRNGSEEFGPPAPDAPARRAGGGGRGRVAADPMAALRTRRDAFLAQNDPLARYQQRLEAIGQLQADLAARNESPLPDDAVVRATEQAMQEYERAVQSVGNATRAAAAGSKEWQMASDGVAKALSGAFEDLILEGQSFDDVLKNLERSLLRIGNRAFLEPLIQQLTQLAASQLGGGAGGGMGGAGGAGGIASIIGSLFGSAGAAGGAKLSVDAAMAAGTMVSVFHQGGMVGAPGAPMRAVPAEVFLDAPRYHSGGMAGGMRFASDEVPAVLRRGEMVLTERQQKAVANRTSTTIVNQIHTPASSEFRNSRGQVEADLSRATQRALARRA